MIVPLHDTYNKWSLTYRNFAACFQHDGTTVEAQQKIIAAAANLQSYHFIVIHDKRSHCHAMRCYGRQNEIFCLWNNDRPSCT